MENLEGFYEGLDTNQSMPLGIDLTSVQSSPERKTTNWKRVEVMFKDCMTNPTLFSKPCSS